jgi:Ca2+-binding RTX toxin-like protein
MTTQPSAFEQLLVEFINRARTDPQAEFDRLIVSADEKIGVQDDISRALTFFDVDLALFAEQLETAEAVAPLAWNEALGLSSARHSELSALFDQQSHNLPGEPGLLDRVILEGYDAPRIVGENVFAFVTSPVYAHAGFYVDWGNGPGGIQDPAGHRDTILSERFSEIGVGVVEVTDESKTTGPYIVTQHFGDRFNTGPKLTGVVIDDRDNDDFYDIGEGLGGVEVVATSGTLRFSTVTYASGGYTVELPRGLGETVFDVTFSGEALGGTVTRQVNIGLRNVKLDIELADVSAAGVTKLGTSARDVLEGTAHDDALDGGHGADLLSGLADDDEIRGGSGADILNGGAGGDVLDGGSGQDTAQYINAMNGVTADLLNAGNNTGEAAGDLYVSVERLDGSSHADTLRGDGADNRIWGRDGNDRIQGRGGDDWLFGNNGDDILNGGLGRDFLVGGAGLDIAQYASAMEAVTADLTDASVNTGEAAGDRYSSIEGVQGTGFDDVLAGNNAANRLWGLNGEDVLWGRGGNDVLLGGNDNDVLDGGLGADVLNGGAGIDTASYKSAMAGVTADLANSRSNTGEAAGDRFTRIENLDGSAFDDVLGGDGAANTLHGQGGIDEIWGRAGDDILFGGAGPDVFVFAVGDGSDVIADFEDGDTLSFIGIAAADVSASDSSAGALISYGAAGDQILLADILVDRLDAATFVFDLA